MKLLVWSFLFGLSTQSAMAEVQLDETQRRGGDHGRRHGQVQCLAENGRGATYIGRAAIGERHRARRKALRRCERDSYRPRSCQIVYCERTRSRGGRGGWDDDRGGRGDDWGRGGRRGDDDRRGGGRGGRRGGRR